MNSKFPIDKFLDQSSSSQKNRIKLVILFFTGGFLLFLAIAMFSPFKDTLLNYLYPKPPSHAASRDLLVGIDASLYSDSSNLITGDQVIAVANRAQGSQTNPKKVTDAINTLEGVNTSEKGVEKAIMFSSYEDVQAYINQIPADVTWILYNMESAMTPLKELKDPVGSGKIIADLAHQSGRKMGFGPSRDLYDMWEGDGRLAEILKYADRVTYQAQNFDNSQGLGFTEDQLIPFLQQKYNFIQTANQANGKNVKFYVQLWYPQQQTQDMIRIFNKLSNPKAADYAGLGGLNNTESVNTVLSGLEGKQEQAFTARPSLSYSYHDKALTLNAGAIVVDTGSTKPIADATVNITIQTPSGTSNSYSLVTDSNGKIIYTFTSSEKGTFTLTIVNVTKGGYTYRPTLTSQSLVIN